MTHHNDQPADTEMVDFMVHSYETILRNAARGTGRDVEPLLRFLRNSDFYESRCSSHHHFAGGTAQHCMEVYLHAHMPHPPKGYLYRLRYWMEYDNWRQMPELSIALVALLHDCCNMSRPSGQESIFHRHGAKSVYLIEQMAGFGLTTEERNAIKHHMHKSKEKVALNVNHSPSRIEHTLNNPLWQMIRTCDICSALQPRSRYQLRTEVEQFVNNMD